MPAFQELPKALRWLRLEAERKQREVAESASITPAMLCYYEQGKREPTLASLEKILDTLGVDVFGLARALALMNPAGRGAQSLQEVYPGPAKAARRGSLPPEVYAYLEVSEELSPAQDAALREMLAGVKRWLRETLPPNATAAPSQSSLHEETRSP